MAYWTIDLRCAPVLSVLALALPSCSEDAGGDTGSAEDAGDDGGWDSADPIHSARTESAKIWCECFWQDNDQYSSYAQCENGRSGSGTDTCEAEIIYVDPLAEEKVNCLIDVQVQYAACIEQAGCNREVVDTQCQDLRTSLNDACPLYPDEVAVQVEECYPDEPFWAVGDDGSMRAVGEDGQSESYPLDEDADLLAIACDGAAKAWVVGEDGTVLTTANAGANWHRAFVPTSAALRAVALISAHTVAAAGDEGSLILSSDDGLTWSSIDAPTVDWTGLAPAQGDTVVLIGRDGTVWRYDDDGFVLAHTASAALHAVASDFAGSEIVAVGEQGSWVASQDGGVSWGAQETEISSDLYAVQISVSGTLAVGEGGIFARRAPSGVVTVEHLTGEALRGIHVDHDGLGAIVGDRGTVLISDDLGASWDSVDVGLTTTLHGVDAPVHAHH